jgi:HD-like signal output (HDOD) protein
MMNRQTTKRILFVDDEPNILDGLGRMLRPMRSEWEMAFALSGPEALEIMRKKSFDVVVSDMRMPQMDGSVFLNKVMELYPETIRFVLSGQADKETIFRSIGPTHQFMSKPCDADVIKSTLNRAFALRDILANPRLKKLISQVSSLPSLPDLYVRIQKELQSEDPSVQRVGKIIEQDVAMSAKVLQLVNSSFFGLRQHVASPSQAVSLLGLDILRSLVLVVHVFSQSKTLEGTTFSIEAIQHHSLAVGRYAQAIAKTEKVETKATDDAFMAGILHDAGKLVLINNLSDRYREALSFAHNNHILLIEAEKEYFGATHAEVGAYLLGLWGFPDPIVEATAFHHVPRCCSAKSFGSLTAIHAANALACELKNKVSEECSAQVDLEYLNELGLADRLHAWRQACEQIWRGCK